MGATPRILGLLGFAVLAPASAAGAAQLTLGSDLSSPATLVQAQGADTAYWAGTSGPASVSIPEDGQVVAIRVRGSALREKGAVSPATMVHFQSLDPAGVNGWRQVYLSSADFYPPVDQPDAITTFEPENLCVKRDGAVAFNTIGGFKWGGSLDAPLDELHYHNGTPWQIFAARKGASTSWYSKDNGTKNGHVLHPHGGTNAREGMGGVHQDRELLMQVVVATGDDRSEPCGGPRRHPDGRLVQTGPAPSYMKVASAAGRPQRPYVTKDRRFSTGVFCGGQQVAACAGMAILRTGNRTLARATFSLPSSTSGRVAMRLRAADFRALDRSPTRTLRATYVLKTTFGTFTTPVTLQR